MVLINSLWQPWALLHARREGSHCVSASESFLQQSDELGAELRWDIACFHFSHFRAK